MNLLNNRGMVINPDKGILVVFEGISGSGKSASIDNLTRYLLESGFDTTSIEWNSNRMIRRVVNLLQRLGVLSPLVFSILQWINFIADYVMIISPSLRRNRIVIADRYIYTALTRDAANGAVGLHGRLLF